MPRQGVPYPSREICSLKCQIDALQRQINELMKSINGVQGDGQGNVSLVSGDPAVVINNDASQNQIEIALDQSELPAAAVRMVNGMTGAVVLAANDIYAGANTVGFEIADLKAENLLRKQGITNEISNRQAADAALQSNINAVSAGLPAAAAAAVAADPTMQGLVTADAQNVKLSGAQTVGGVKTFTAIPIVPTPAAGSTDGSVPNTNWISQTGDSGPNNLIHKTGAETKNGKFTINDGMIGYQNDWHQTDKPGMNLNDYCIFAKIPGGYGGRYQIIDFCQSSNTACAYGRLMLRRNASAIMPVWLYRKGNGANNPLQSDSIHVLHDGTDIYLAWKKLAPYGSLFAALTFDMSYGTVQKVSNQNISWYTTAQMIVTNDISAYTDVTVVE